MKSKDFANSTSRRLQGASSIVITIKTRTASEAKSTASDLAVSRQSKAFQQQCVERLCMQFANSRLSYAFSSPRLMC